MLSAPLRYCAVPKCPNKVRFGRCSEHQKVARAHATRFRGGHVSYGRPWRRAVNEWLNSNPLHVLCAECKKQGLVVMGTETDHIVPHRGDAALFWDSQNWQRLCEMHHGQKTAREVGFHP
jgi:5-methylcytosine-specific restriction enzyme A